MVNGRLSVTVVAGRKLRDTDWFSKVDPYVVLQCGPHVHRTTVRKNAGKNPFWNEEYAFDVTDMAGTQVHVTVKDDDTGKDDTIGSVVVNFADAAMTGRPIDAWYELRHHGYRAGELQLRMRFQPHGAPAGGYYPGAVPAAPAYGYPAAAPQAPMYAAAPQMAYPHPPASAPGYPTYPPPQPAYGAMVPPPGSAPPAYGMPPAAYPHAPSPYGAPVAMGYPAAGPPPAAPYSAPPAYGYPGSAPAGYPPSGYPAAYPGGYREAQ